MTSTCTKCLTSIDLLFHNHSIDPSLLSEFVRESLDLSRTHVLLVSDSLSMEQRLRYLQMHSQAELLLSIIRGLHVSRKQLH